MTLDGQESSFMRSLTPKLRHARARCGARVVIEDGDLRAAERTVFVHTGGLPGLFGSPVAAELAARTAVSAG